MSIVAASEAGIHYEFPSTGIPRSDEAIQQENQFNDLVPDFFYRQGMQWPKVRKNVTH